MKDDDVPKIEYEGVGFLHGVTVTYDNSSSKIFQYELIAIKIPDGESFVVNGTNDTVENRIATFTGTITRNGDSGFSLSGNLINSIAITIQYVKMNEVNNDGPEDEIPEYKYEPGIHHIEFSGNIIGWLTK